MNNLLGTLSLQSFVHSRKHLNQTKLGKEKTLELLGRALSK